MRKTILMVAMALLFIAPKVWADGWVDGNELKKVCSSNNDFDQGQCLGFIAAATSSAEGHDYCEKTKGGKKVIKRSTLGDCGEPIQLALPEKMKLRQAKDIVAKYLDDNPAELHRDAVYIVDSAMINAFGFRKIAP